MKTEIKQEFLDKVLARAKASNYGLNDAPKTPLNFDSYSQQDFDSVALILVNAFEAKYDLVSIFKAALEQTHEDALKVTPEK